MEEGKKVYFSPELTIHGNVEDITLVGGSVPPTDIPMGVQGEAFPLS